MGMFREECSGIRRECSWEECSGIRVVDCSWSWGSGMFWDKGEMIWGVGMFMLVLLVSSSVFNFAGSAA